MNSEMIHSRLLFLLLFTACNAVGQDYLGIVYTGTVNHRSYPFPMVFYSGEIIPNLPKEIEYPIDLLEFKVPVHFAKVDSITLYKLFEIIDNSPTELDSLPPDLPYQFGMFEFHFGKTPTKVYYSNTAVCSQLLIISLYQELLRRGVSKEDKSMAVLQEYASLFQKNSKLEFVPSNSKKE
jgi:hypothetical protein